MLIHTCSYKQSAHSEVLNTNDKILITVSINIPIVLYPTFPVLFKDLDKDKNIFDWCGLHTASD